MANNKRLIIMGIVSVVLMTLAFGINPLLWWEQMIEDLARLSVIVFAILFVDRMTGYNIRKGN